VDPLYLSWKAKLFDFRTRFIELADEINSKMPEYVVYRIFEVLNGIGKSIKGSRILVLGVSYKKDVGDVRESPNLKVITLLLEKGAEVIYNDPYVPEFYHFEVHWHSQELTIRLLKEVDCVLILTAHSLYDWELITKNSNLVLDTRNAGNGILNVIRSQNIHKL
jgi:UDP-N-acetyl-D-glucosamine dehydrogenase